MTIISAIPGGSGDAFAQLVEGLRHEFGCTDVGAIAARIFEAEEADFHWNARVSERYLGQHSPFDCGDDDLSSELSRMAFLSRVADRWHAGVCLVDGEGLATDCLWQRSFHRREDARDMFARAR